MFSVNERFLSSVLLHQEVIAALPEGYDMKRPAKGAGQSTRYQSLEANQIVLIEMRLAVAV